MSYARFSNSYWYAFMTEAYPTKDIVLEFCQGNSVDTRGGNPDFGLQDVQFPTHVHFTPQELMQDGGRDRAIAFLRLKNPNADEDDFEEAGRIIDEFLEDMKEEEPA